MKMLLVFWILLDVSQHALAGVVEVHDGAESVLLACIYSGQIPDESLIRWISSDLTPQTVHVRREEKDDLTDQNQHFRGRTSMNPDALYTRNFSLTLKTPRLSDQGTYTCSISDGKAELKLEIIILKVKDDQEEVEATEAADSIILPCTTSANLPEDTSVVWTRSEPEFRTVHVFSNSSRYQQKQDDLYCSRTKMNEDLLRTGDVSLTLRYPTDRDSGSYICTVYRDEDILRQKVVLEYVKKEILSSWAQALLVLLVLVLLVSAGLLYHYRQYFISVYRVEVEPGVESVLLPCKTIKRLPEDARVEWKDNDDFLVHVYQNGSDQNQSKGQDQIYGTRTRMKEDMLRTGDLSLTLRWPTDKDSGTYTCGISIRDGVILMKKRVDLEVKVQQVEVEEGAESVLLPFRTTPDLPGDTEVVWWHSKDRKVHVYQNGCDHPEEQNQDYRTRTKMNEDLLRTGDLRLTLRCPTDGDKGHYTCKVKIQNEPLRRKKILLKVKAKTVQVQPEDIRTRTSSIDPSPLLADQKV